MTEASPIERVLLLAPSEGQGGGIERYIRGVESALRSSGVEHKRINLRNSSQPPPSLLRKITFAFKAWNSLRRHPAKTRVIMAHCGLIPVLFLIRRLDSYAGAVVIYYGSEVWAKRRLPGRRGIQGADVRCLTISSFTSGAMVQDKRATPIRPFLDQAWYETLIAAAKMTPHRPAGKPFRAVTVFRLPDWESKGLATIVRAMESLSDPVELVVAGSGTVSPELLAFVRAYPWVHLKPGLADDVLAGEYAGADVALLATRTQTGNPASGEGFGLCLVEAQLAGTAVIGPAFGGSHDTFLQGITGVSPFDESPSALAAVLTELVAAPERLAALSLAAANWSRNAFEPAAAARSLSAYLLSPSATR